MKNPLNYQTTEYDCGPTTMMNAMSYLFKREEIMPDIVKCIMQYCLDGYNKRGEVYIGANSAITECLQQKGAVVAKVMLGGWHYVLLTGIRGEYIDLFDPYFRQRPFQNENIHMIWDEPKKRNRSVHSSILNGTGKDDYALGEIDRRECVLMYNTNTRQTMDQIEYII